MQAELYEHAGRGAMTWRVLLATVMMAGVLADKATAHLCNDVFVQAKDNLAVKVDVRDGQLRIGREASFRVYLLNTMDRGIVSINLEVLSDQFDAEITPSPEWQKYPRLQCAKRGGKKVYFTVQLQRKTGVADGRYKIGLRLFNGKNRDMEFKTVDLNAAASVHRIETPVHVKVDGSATKEEWQSALLATDFYEYVKSGRYYQNQPCREEQCRFRVTADQRNVYVLMAFRGGKEARQDIGTILLAGADDQKPEKIEIDRVSGQVVNASIDKTRIAVRRAGTDQTMLECAVPLDALNLQDNRSLYVNFTRTLQGEGDPRVSYWRGNQFSLDDPIVYEKLILAN